MILAVDLPLNHRQVQAFVQLLAEHILGHGCDGRFLAINLIPSVNVRRWLMQDVSNSFFTDESNDWVVFKFIKNLITFLKNG